MVAPRGSYPFFLATLKKPKAQIQAVLDTLDGMTDEEIDKAMVPKWTKPHFKRYRKENYPTPEEKEELRRQAEYLKQFEEQESLGLKKNQKFEVRKYDGETRWLGLPGKLEEEIVAGDIFMIISDNRVRWGTSNLMVDQQQMGFVQQRSESIGRMTYEEYAAYRNEQLKQKFGMEDHEPTPGKITSGDYTHTADRYAGEILNSQSTKNIGGNGFPVLFKRH